MGSILLIVIGMFAGAYVSKQLELFKIRKSLYTIKRTFEYRSSGEDWANNVRSWFELHPDEFKLIKLKITGGFSMAFDSSYTAKLIYQSLTGKRLAFSAIVGKIGSPVEKIIENGSMPKQEKAI